MRPSRNVGCGLVLALVCTGAQAQSAQDSEAIPVHYAYEHGGTGFFSVGGKSAQVVRMPFSWNVREAKGGHWGVKVRLPVSIGFHELDLRRPSGRQLRQSAETVAFTPGIELEILLREDLRLKPYAELGLGAEISGDLAALLYDAGVKSRWLVSTEPLEVYIGSALRYNGFSLLEGDSRDSYVVAEVGAELRWPGGFEIQGEPATLGAYLIAREFLPEIELVPLRGDPVTIDSQLEAGITLGTGTGIRLWGRVLPRLGLAYRWGDGLSSFRLNFGFPL